MDGRCNHRLLNTAITAVKKRIKEKNAKHVWDFFLGTRLSGQKCCWTDKSVVR